MKLGEAFQITISTNYIYKSQKFWEMLGFHQLDGDSNPFSWRLMADPSMTLMLNEDGRDRMMPTWYEPDIEEKVREMVKNGVKLAQNYDLDNLPALVEFLDPDGFKYLIVEREGSDLNHPEGPQLADLPQEDWKNEAVFPNSKVGIFGEYSIPVKNMDASIRFWENLGFELKLKMETPMQWAILRDEFVTIGLYITSDFTEPAITYFHPEQEKNVLRLKDEEIEMHGRFTGKSDKHQTLISPEGKQVFLFSME